VIRLPAIAYEPARMGIGLRLGNPTGFGRTAGRLVSAAASAWLLAITLPVSIAIANASTRPVGDDFTLYRDAAERWLAGGQFYPASQLAGHWAIGQGGILYPPVTLWLFVPFTVLPAVLWWLIPAAVVGWAMWRLRPGALSWPVMAFLVGFSPFPLFVRAGNPMIWALAAMFAGCATVGPSVLVLLKPSLAPFAVLGIWRRRWWLWAAGFAFACLPFGLMWVDWARSLLGSDGTLAYSYREIGVFLVPLVAWAGRQRPSQEASAPRAGATVSGAPARSLAMAAGIRQRASMLRPVARRAR
jgi:hypothetical protein